MGPFIVDFVCFENKVILEVDGSQHLEREKMDAERTNFLERSGFHVLRFTNDEVKNELNAVVEKIMDVCSRLDEKHHPHLPSPFKGEEKK